jgi:hypothetical protein
MQFPTFIHPFLPSSIPSFIHSFLHPFLPSLLHSFLHSFIPWSFIYFRSHSFNYVFSGNAFMSERHQLTTLLTGNLLPMAITVSRNFRPGAAGHYVVMVTYLKQMYISHINICLGYGISYLYL